MHGLTFWILGRALRLIIELNLAQISDVQLFLFQEEEENDVIRSYFCPSILICHFCVLCRWPFDNQCRSPDFRKLARSHFVAAQNSELIHNTSDRKLCRIRRNIRFNIFCRWNLLLNGNKSYFRTFYLLSYFFSCFVRPVKIQSKHVSTSILN